MSQNSGMSKRQRFSMPTRAQHTAAEILHSGQTEEIVQEIPINMLEQDPANRPLTKLSLANPEAIDPADPNVGLKKKFLEGIRDLALSIRAVNGIKEPLRVYKLGAKYRIIFGERRALAAVVAGLKSVPGIVDTAPPTGLRRIQAVENIQREDVLPWERVQALKDLLAEEAATGKPIETSSGLVEAMGISNGYASMLLGLIEAPPEVAEAMQRGVISNVRTAYEIAKIKDPKARHAALETAVNGATQQAAITAGRRASVKHAPRRGRKRATVNLGRTEDFGFVKQIIVALGKPNQRRGVDWDNVDEVQRVWDRFRKGE